MSKVLLYLVLLTFLSSCEQSIKHKGIDLNNIELAYWFDGKRNTFTFTFDDNTPKHKEIGDLLSNYDLKGSFYVNPGFPNFQDYKDIYIQLIKDGHEIGNHTFEHKNLVNSDSHEIERQISKGAFAIEQELGIYPLSFVHPYNAAIDSVNKIVYKYHLFSRIISLYNLEKRKIYDVSQNWPDLNEVKDVINLGEKNWIIIAGHGFGVNDVSWEFLENLCNELKNRDDVWVERLSTVAAYDYIREEANVSKEFIDDTIHIKINNFDRHKFQRLEKLPMTIKVPVLSEEVSLTTDNPHIGIRFQNLNYFFNFDLKQINQFTIFKSKKGKFQKMLISLN